MLCRHQQQLSNVVWVEIAGDCSVGPQVLPHAFIGNHYRDFLLHDLPKPLTLGSRMLYMHDGAPAHSSRAVRGVLS
jgi:hypothetical protein